MVATGIICEYNPFHSGHFYQLTQIREAFPEDVIVCCMSGNFVQRGDYAIFPKKIRASAAVACGADLVVELPVPWAVSSAPRFAKAGVSLLSSLGCSRLCFGSECGDHQRLLSCADFLTTERFTAALKEKLSLGLSFPSAREAAARAVGFTDASLLVCPNDVLALSYINAISELKLSMDPFPIKRIGSAHDSDSDDADFPSASSLRSRMLEKPGYLPSGIPPEARAIFSDAIRDGYGPVNMHSMDAAHMSVLRRLTVSDLSLLPDMKEGFEKRLFRAIAEASSPDEAADMAKTKRYTHSRIRRQLLCAYLGLYAQDLEALPPYAGIVAFNDRGRRYLATQKKSSFPIINKPARHNLSGYAKALFEKTVIWDDLYMLACPGEKKRVAGSSMRATPEYIRDIK